MRLFLARARAVRPGFELTARQPPATSPRSSTTSAACRSPSSWPPRGCGSSRPPRSTSGSRASSTCRVAGPRTCRSASARCAARSRGATTCSSRPPAGCSSGWRCSWAGSTCRRAEAVGGGTPGDPDPHRHPRRPRRPVPRSRAARRTASRGSRSSSRSGSSRWSGSRRPASAEVARERHARWFLDLARSVEPELTGDRQREALDRLEREHANLRAAIDWGDAHGDAEVALGVATSIWRLWQKRGHLAEAKVRMAALVDAPVVRRRAGPPARACPRGAGRDRATGTATSPARAAVVRDGARGLARAGRPGARSRTRCTTSRSPTRIGTSGAATRPASRLAAALLDEALALYRELGDEHGQANVLWGMGIQHYFARRERRRRARRSSRPSRSRSGSATAPSRRGASTSSAPPASSSATSTARGSTCGRAPRCSTMRATSRASPSSSTASSALAAAEGDLPRAARLQGLARRIQAASGHRARGRRRRGLRAGDPAPTPRTGSSREELERYRAEGADAGPRGRRCATRWASDVGGARAVSAAAADGHGHAPVHRHRGVHAPPRARRRRGVRRAARGGAADRDRRGRGRRRRRRSGRRATPTSRRSPRRRAGVRAAVAAQRALAAHAWPAGDVRVRMGIHTGEVPVDRRRLPRHRGPPRGAGRRGRPRRPGAGLGGDAGARGRRRRDRLPGPRRAPPQGHRARRAAVPGGGAGPRDRLPAAASRGRRAARQPADRAHLVRRAGGGRAGVGAARPDAAPDPDRAGRDRQDAALAPARRRVPRAVRRRGVVRAARGRLGSRADRLGDRGRARAAGDGPDADRRRPGAPRLADRPARARQLRAARRRRAAGRGPAPGGARADAHRVQPRAAADRRRAGVPGPAARPATGRRRSARRGRRLGGRPAVRGAGRWPSGRTSRSPPRTPPTWPRSSGGSTGCRWRSSSPRRAIRLLGAERDRAPARRPARACCRAAAATCRSASGRCAARSSGATTCWTPTSGGCSRGCRRSRAAGRWTSPRTSARCPGEAAGPPVVDGLEDLAEQSLVRIADDPHGDLRFAMLETIHEYASERLAASGERDVLRERHAAAVLAFAEAGARRRRRPPHLARPDGRRARQPAVRVRVPARDRRSRAGVAPRRGGVAVLAHAGAHPRGTAARRARAGDAGPPDGRLAARGCGPSRPPAGSPTGAATCPGPGRLYVDAEAEARLLGDEGAIANALYNRFFAREGMDDPASWRQGVTAEPHAPRPGHRDLDAARRRGGHRAGPVGDRRVPHVSRRARRGGGGPVDRASRPSSACTTRSGSPGASSPAPSPGWSAVRCRSRRPTSPGRSAPSGWPATCPGWSSAWPGCRPGCSPPAARRRPTRWPGRRRRIVEETGLRLAVLGSSTEGDPGPDPDTTDPDLRAAFEAGRRWSRAEAVDRTVVFAEELAAGTPVADAASTEA